MTGSAIHFGGAVLLPTRALGVENWDPRLYSNEEVELYTRLRSDGVAITRLDCLFVAHSTEKLTFLQKVLGNFVRRDSFLGKKFSGVGQVLRARVTEGRVWSLVRWFPEPFLLWLSLLAAPLLYAFFGWLPALACVALVTTFIILRRSIRLVIVYIAFLPQAIQGWRHFDANWRPRIQEVFADQLLDS